MTSQKIVIFDADGPLYPTDEETLKIVKPSLTLQQMEAHGSWNFFTLLSKEEKTNLEKLWEDYNWWLNLPPKPASQEAVEEARREGHIVLFGTSPWESCMGWSDARSLSLKKHYGAKGRDDIIITAAKEYIYGHVIIDDRPSNLKAWNKRWKNKGGMALMFETAFNKNDPEADEFYPRVRIIDGKWHFIKRSLKNKQNDTVS